MGDVTYKQSTEIVAGKTPQSQGAQIKEIDFQISPPDKFSNSDYNESLSHRYVIPAQTTDEVLCVGTISLIKVLVVNPESNIKMKLVNSDGTSQNLEFEANRISILHVQLTQLLATNDTDNEIKGVFFIAGD